MTAPIRTFAIGKLHASVYPNRADMGAAAAEKAAAILRATLAGKGCARLILANSPSQDELLAALTAAPGIDWGRVTLFHMDEFIGLPADHPASFRKYQQDHTLSRIRPAAFHGIRGEAEDPQGECARYAALLGEAPIDLVCMGIGENGHIALNDPPTADFNDPITVKIVDLDDACRRQQVHDGCFPDLDSVPRRAITLTCPALLSAGALVCVVPGRLKADAVSDALRAPVSTACPATILRTHPHASLFLDTNSAKFFLDYK
jgi:glucosamine-6-phosphate deaminase